MGAIPVEFRSCRLLSEQNDWNKCVCAIRLFLVVITSVFASYFLALAVQRVFILYVDVFYMIKNTVVIRSVCLTLEGVSY